MTVGNVFWDMRNMQPEDGMPSILAIGDSWFWYPFPGGSLLNQLGPLVAPKQHNILAAGYNGAEAYDSVYGKYEKAVRTALKLYGDGLSAVFISGGGNDFAGFSVAKKNEDRVVLIKSAGTLTKEDWANEIHPKPVGFEKIAMQRWKPVLRDYGLAA